jgi:hypothetical protein
MAFPPYLITTISPLYLFAKASASAVLPTAVGPTIAIKSIWHILSTFYKNRQQHLKKAVKTEVIGMCSERYRHRILPLQR